MNALNILSGISATPPPSPPRSRTSSASNVDDVRHALRDGHSSSSLASVFPDEKTHDGQENDKPPPVPADPSTDETVALLNRYELRPEPITPEKQHWRLWRITKRVVDAVATSLKVVLATIAAPGRYVVACLYDDQGNFSAMLPVRSMFRSRRRQTGAYPPSPRQDMEEKEGYLEKPKLRPKERHRDQFPASSSANALTSDSDSEKLPSTDMEDSPARNTRSKTASATSKDKDDTAPAKRSIRIKLHSGDSLRRTRQMSKSSQSSQTQEDKVAAVANSLKSPSSPAATKLKYPRAPAAPRPLVPRRQPSYILTHSTETPKKTLIIDLDETLIHSMAKGGRMSTGHMVEVKFQGPIGGSGVVLGPQVPILYYVHERPFCHEFLRKVREKKETGGENSPSPPFFGSKKSLTLFALFCPPL